MDGLHLSVRFACFAVCALAQHDPSAAMHKDTADPRVGRGAEPAHPFRQPQRPSHVHHIVLAGGYRHRGNSGWFWEGRKGGGGLAAATCLGWLKDLW